MVNDEIFETSNKAIDDSLQKIAYNISQVPGQIPAVLPPEIPAVLPEVPGVPEGIPEAIPELPVYPDLPITAAPVPAAPPPPVVPELPAGYPQVPPGYPQVPPGYPQVPPGYQVPAGYPQVPGYIPAPGAVPVPGTDLVNAGVSLEIITLILLIFVLLCVMLVYCVKRGMQGKFDIDPDVATGKTPNTTLTFKNPLSRGGAPQIDPHCEGEHNPAYSNDNIDNDSLAPPARSKRSRQKSGGGRSDHSATDESICMDME